MSFRTRLTSPAVIMILPPLFWAGNAIAGRMAVGQLPPIALAFWRWLFALLIVLPFGLPKMMAQWNEVRHRWKVLALIALFSVTAYNTLLYVALTSTTAVNATLVSAAIPVAIVLLSWLWLGEKVGLSQSLGIAISLSGVVLVITRGDPGNLQTLGLEPGDFWVLAAVVSWAIYSVLLRRYPPGLSPLALLTVQMILGWLFLTPFYLWELTTGQAFLLTVQSAGLIAFVAIFPSILAYHLWNQGVASLGANLAGQYTYLIPIFTALLAVFFLDEPFRWFHAAGLVTIIGGIRLASKS
ncbi:DMT family transporter [Telmatospirillum siberiense]|uniref:DMT family transporter n=1 Tax=Telmatospirillum siberiense TaxID=382514 RepID=UPI00130416FF|nr:DMT family transporter [Telmatospirillum siberiense]